MDELWLLTTATSLLALICAAIALLTARTTSADTSILSARLASLSGELSKVEANTRLTPSALAELADVRDAIDKGNALLKRVNSREVMRSRRELETVDTGNSKDELRRRAGLIAGKPAPHQ